MFTSCSWTFVLFRGSSVWPRDENDPQYNTNVHIMRPGNYQLVNRNNVREQLAKGGFRLAKLLDAIFAQ